MPKLTIKTPKMCRDRKQAYSQHKGKRYYHGVWGTPAALQKYKRFIAALMENPHLPQPDRKIGDLLVSELAAGFLGYVEPRLDRTDFRHFKRAIGFLVEIYGAHTVNEFSPKKLKVCRSKMVGAGTLSRPYINKQIGRIIRVFAWGVEEEHVQPNTVAALREVKNLQRGEQGTFDNPPRQEVPDEVVKRTLPFMSPTVAAMVKLQRLTGIQKVCERFGLVLYRDFKIDRRGLWDGKRYFEYFVKYEEHGKNIPLFIEGLNMQEITHVGWFENGEKERLFDEVLKEKYGEKYSRKAEKIKTAKNDTDENKRILECNFPDLLSEH